MIYLRCTNYVLNVVNKLDFTCLKHYLGPIVAYISSEGKYIIPQIEQSRKAITGFATLRKEG